MEIPVRLGAGLAQELGVPRLRVTLPEGATAADLLDHLRRAYPHAPRLGIALAVAAGQYLAADQPIPPDQEVALLLPAAGG